MLATNGANVTIKNATVNIQLADSTNSFYTATSDASVGVTLKLSKTMEDEKAESIANFLATSVGNTNTDNITILSSDGSTLYSGANNSTVSGVSYNSKLKYKERIENTTKNSLRQGCSQYDCKAIYTGRRTGTGTLFRVL